MYYSEYLLQKKKNAIPKMKTSTDEVDKFFIGNVISKKDSQINKCNN